MRPLGQPHLRNSRIVLLVADPPPVDRDRPEGVDSPALRSEALVSLARAVFAAGSRLALPIDVDIAPLVGTVALDFAVSPTLLSRDDRLSPPLLVVETEGAEPAARRLLTPLATRGALVIVGSDGMPVAPVNAGPAANERSIENVRRHTVTEDLVRATSPALAVLISPRGSVREELDILRRRNTKIVMFGGSNVERNLGRDLDTEDPTERLLGSMSQAGSTRPGRIADDGSSPPYAFLMQRLVAELRDVR